MIDEDGNGYLDYEELRNLLGNVNKQHIKQG